MIRKSKTTFIFTSILLIISIILAFSLRNREVTPTEIQPIIQTQEGFTLTSTYEDEDVWNFKIEGELPNPCFSAETSTLISETYPEEVSINLIVSRPHEGEICAEVIQNINLEGSYKASKYSNLKFEVVQSNKQVEESSDTNSQTIQQDEFSATANYKSANNW